MLDQLEGRLHKVCKYEVWSHSLRRDVNRSEVLLRKDQINCVYNGIYFK